MGSLMYEILGSLEKKIDFPEDMISQIKAELNLKSDEEIELFAAQTRKNLKVGLGPIHNLVKLLENNGVLVTMMPESCRQVDAFSTWLNGRPFIFLANKGSTTLTRFDAAHELLHLLGHADVLPGDKELERQANRFAGAFLLPRETFYDECPRRLNWDHFYELSERWGVSVACLVVRAYQLGCLTEATYRRAFVQLNQMGERADKQDLLDIEKPTLLRKSLDFFDLPSQSELAENLGLNTPILNSLVECNGI
jgi:Zn-dependent peptidase ImmA (M78 family)